MVGQALTDRRRELIERAFEALNRRDRPTLTELIPDDTEIRSTLATFESGGVYRGAEEFFQLYDTLLSTWDELTWYLDSIRDVGSRTAILYRLSGVAKVSGVPLEQSLGQVWSWRRGDEAVPSRIEIFTDPRETLAAAERD